MTKPAAAVDTYLLRVLSTLVAERSVSRTAIRLNQTQPAVSTAGARDPARRSGHPGILVISRPR